LFGHDDGYSPSVDEIDLADGRVRTVVQNAFMPDRSNSTLSWVAFNAADSTRKLIVGGVDSSGTPAGKGLLTSDDFHSIYSPRLSPDGQSVAFSAWGRTGTSVPAKGLALDALLNPLQPAVAEAHTLSWDVWRIGADGSGLQGIVEIGTDEQSLAWMPDGQAIAIARFGGLYLA
jgi:Tol biopolymer transport system component